ncbi:MAG: hypothetical protein U5N86_10960 [Planctomycetota bacterium]|nr:hypothetical protein [Planctomycetota bacterium]
MLSSPIIRRISRLTYPLEFTGAVLSSVLGDTNKLIDRLEECKQAGYKILPPDVNESARTFIKSGENGIRFALGAIKGVGGIAADLIYEEARRKPFRDLFDLCERVDLHVVNKGTLDALISAGATESLEGNMAQQLDILPDAISNGQSVQAEAATRPRLGFLTDSKRLQVPVCVTFPNFRDKRGSRASSRRSDFSCRDIR